MTYPSIQYGSLNYLVNRIYFGRLSSQLRAKKRQRTEHNQVIVLSTWQMEQINAFFHICCAFSSLDSIYLLDTKIDRFFFIFLLWAGLYSDMYRAEKDRGCRQLLTANTSGLQGTRCDSPLQDPQLCGLKKQDSLLPGINPSFVA